MTSRSTGSEKATYAKARLYMLDHATEERFRIGCVTGCQEFPLFAVTLEEARTLAKKHAEEQRHVSSIKWVQTTSIEVWAWAVESPDA